jgi:radical SAM superfamily enzyme YgiQ (UPF0313 family)
MKITLINPPYKRNIIRRWYCSVETDNYLYPPLELIYIGGMLKRNKKIKTILIDCIAENINKFDLRKRLKQFNPDYTIFMPGFQTINEDIETMENAIKAIKTKLVCFGYLPSLFSKNLLKKYNIDIIVRDQPELTVFDILSGNKLEKIKGISYKKNGKIIINKKRTINDIDKLSFPDRNLLNNNLYSTPFPDKKPITTILTSRECPYKCNFCISANEQFTTRSINSVIEEIDECVKKFGMRTLRIIDNCFTANRNRVISFCDVLIKRDYEIDWVCLSRPDNLDEQLLRKMKKAGCKRILIGVESGSDKILNYYNRDHNLGKVKYVFRTMRKIGITSLAFLLIGATIESKEDIKKSIKFAKEINPDFIFIDVLTPIPGTSLYDKLKKENKIKFSLTPYHVDYKTLLSRKQLQKEMINFYLSFYLRSSYLIRMGSWFFKNPKSFIRMILTFLNWKKRKYVFGYT